MKLNEEQYDTAMKMKALATYVREQFPNGCDCYPDCTGCPFEGYTDNQIESQLCDIIETLGDY